MMRSKNWPGALALIALAACGGGSKSDGSTIPGYGPDGTTAGGADVAIGDSAPLPSIPDQPAAEPDAVLAVVSMGDPAGQLAETATFADAVQPGMGAMLQPAQILPGLTAMAGAPGLDGFALDRPMWMILLDAKKSGGSAVLVVAVSDGARLKSSVAGSAEMIVHGGYAAVGSKSALQVAAPWALSSLVTTAPRKELAVVIHMQRLVAGYGDEIEQGMRAGMGASQRPQEIMIADGAFSALRQIDRIEGTVSANAGGVTAAGWLVPLASSQLAQFAGMQQPTDYGFAARLGAGSWPFLVAARLDFGPFKDFFVKTAMAAGGPAAQIGQVFDLVGKEHAFALAPVDGSVNVTALVEVSDAKAVAGMLDLVVQGMVKSGPLPWDSMAATVKATALKTKGAVFHEIGFAPGKDASAESKAAHDKTWGKAGMKLYLGVAGNYLAANLEKSGKQAATRLAASASAKTVKPAHGKAIATAIAGSIERKESALMLFDLALLAARGSEATPAKAMPAAPPVVLGVGFGDGKIGGHFHLPVEQVQAAARGGM